MKCTVKIWRSWVWTLVRSNLGCVVFLLKSYLNNNKKYPWKSFKLKITHLHGVSSHRQQWDFNLRRGSWIYCVIQSAMFFTCGCVPEPVVIGQVLCYLWHFVQRSKDLCNNNPWIGLVFSCRSRSFGAVVGDYRFGGVFPSMNNLVLKM